MRRQPTAALDVLNPLLETFRAGKVSNQNVATALRLRVDAQAQLNDHPAALRDADEALAISTNVKPQKNFRSTN